MSEETPQQDKAVFNNAAEYCKSIITIERAIAEAFLKKDYTEANDGLDILWMELYEWFLPEEEVEQNEIRKRQQEAYKRIMIAINNKQSSVSTSDIELFRMRTIMLKRVIHRSGLRMAKQDDESGTPSLMRKAKHNYFRR